jgi:hypothetical protein
MEMDDSNLQILDYRLPDSSQPRQAGRRRSPKRRSNRTGDGHDARAPPRLELVLDLNPANMAHELATVALQTGVLTSTLRSALDTAAVQSKPESADGAGSLSSSSAERSSFAVSSTTSRACRPTRPTPNPAPRPPLRAHRPPISNSTRSHRPHPRPRPRRSAAAPGRCTRGSRAAASPPASPRAARSSRCS